MTDFPMCPTCRRADIDVMMARDVRDACPHCGGVLVESLRACCLPDCNHVLPVTSPMPVCRPCGIKIALVFASEAERHKPDALERRRAAEAEARNRRAQLAAKSVVYYVRLDDARIKIGYTSDLRSRLAALRAHPSALLAIEPGARTIESQRHAQFSTERISRKVEEFYPSERLLEWIAKMREQNGVPGWANVPDTRPKVRRS